MDNTFFGEMNQNSSISLSGKALPCSTQVRKTGCCKKLIDIIL